MWKVSKSMTIFDNYQTEIKKKWKTFFIKFGLNIYKIE